MKIEVAVILSSAVRHPGFFVILMLANAVVCYTEGQPHRSGGIHHAMSDSPFNIRHSTWTVLRR